MQKISVLLAITIISNTNNVILADPHPQQYAVLPEQASRFLDAEGQRIDEYAYQASRLDEYTYQENNMYNEDDALVIDEYDNNISDHVQPPQLCATNQLLATIVGSLLIQYFNMQNMAQLYFKELKEVLSKWYVAVHNMM